MRKALKIKTLILGLSWMVIFLHGIVPHMHADHGEHKPHSSVCTHADSHHKHHGEIEETDNDLILYSSATHADHSVCHFNPNLFSQINIDVSYISEISSEIIFVKAGIEIIYQDVLLKFTKPPLLTCSLLRAPPIA